MGELAISLGGISTIYAPHIITCEGLYRPMQG